ncbi:hypothetical protein HDU76_004731 [Blyttiomyces sp. JEL0837]|nr:hypothetical protein HDU76_004731 [Blyttiomyces sp. JEL0837]
MINCGGVNQIPGKRQCNTRSSLYHDRWTIMILLGSMTASMFIVVPVYADIGTSYQGCHGNNQFQTKFKTPNLTTKYTIPSTQTTVTDCALVCNPPTGDYVFLFPTSQNSKDVTCACVSATDTNWVFDLANVAGLSDASCQNVECSGGTNCGGVDNFGIHYAAYLVTVRNNGVNNPPIGAAVQISISMQQQASSMSVQQSIMSIQQQSSISVQQQLSSMSVFQQQQQQSSILQQQQQQTSILQQIQIPSNVLTSAAVPAATIPPPILMTSVIPTTATASMIKPTSSQTIKTSTTTSATKKPTSTTSQMQIKSGDANNMNGNGNNNGDMMSTTTSTPTNDPNTNMNMGISSSSSGNLSQPSSTKSSTPIFLSPIVLGISATVIVLAGVGAAYVYYQRRKRGVEYGLANGGSGGKDGKIDVDGELRRLIGRSRRGSEVSGGVGGGDLESGGGNAGNKEGPMLHMNWTGRMRRLSDGNPVGGSGSSNMTGNRNPTTTTSRQSVAGAWNAKFGKKVVGRRLSQVFAPGASADRGSKNVATDSRQPYSSESTGYIVRGSNSTVTSTNADMTTTTPNYPYYNCEIDPAPVPVPVPVPASMTTLSPPHSRRNSMASGYGYDYSNNNENMMINEAMIYNPPPKMILLEQHQYQHQYQYQTKFEIPGPPPTSIPTIPLPLASSSSSSSSSQQQDRETTERNTAVSILSSYHHTYDRDSNVGDSKRNGDGRYESWVSNESVEDIVDYNDHVKEQDKRVSKVSSKGSSRGSSGKGGAISRLKRLETNGSVASEVPSVLKDMLDWVPNV